MAGDSAVVLLELRTNQAKGDLGQFNSTLDKTVQTSQKASGGLKLVEKGAEDVGKKLGVAERSVNGLAGAMGLLSPELQNATRSVGDVVGALDIFASAGTTAFAILGPAAVAVGALALAYKYFKDELDEANKKMDDAATAATKASAAYEKFAASRERVAISHGIATGQYAPGTDSLNAITNQLSSERGDERAQLEARALAAAKDVQARPSDNRADNALLHAKQALKDFDDQLANDAATLYEDAEAKKTTTEATHKLTTAVRTLGQAASISAAALPLNAQDYGPFMTAGFRPGVVGGTTDSGTTVGSSIGGGYSVRDAQALSVGTVGGKTQDEIAAEDELHQTRMANTQAEISLVLQMAEAVASIANDLANAFGANDPGKEHPNSAKNWIKGLLGGAEIVGGVLTANPALVAMGVGTEASLASDIHNQKQAAGHASGWLQGARSLAVGGYSGGSTMAMLHAGERVIPASGAGGQTARVSNQVGSARDWQSYAGGGASHVHFHGPVVGSIQPLLKEIDKQMAMGRGYSRAISGSGY